MHIIWKFIFVRGKERKTVVRRFYGRDIKECTERSERFILSYSINGWIMEKREILERR